MRNKLFLFALIPFLWFTNAIPVLAYKGPLSENTSTQTFIESGYTSEGIYYEVYDIPLSDGELLLNTSTQKYVSREIIFQAILIPPTTITQSITEDGITYSGQLRLFSYYQDSEKTYATYKGYLYPTN